MPSRATSFSDSFTRADNADLGPNWDSGYTGFPALNLVGNRVRATSLDVDNAETVNAVSLPNDQWSQVTIPTFIGAQDATVRTIVRANAPGGFLQGYFASANINQSSGVNTYIGYFDGAGGDNVIGATLTTTWGSGDILAIEVIGTTLQLYRNGSVLITRTDSQFASGRAGLAMYVAGASGSVANVELDDFLCGGFRSFLLVRH